MKLSGIFSTRNITLFAFILVVLLLGSMFNVKVGPESFVEGAGRSGKRAQPVANRSGGNSGKKSEEKQAVRSIGSSMLNSWKW
jgi:hypothetical protein